MKIVKLTVENLLRLSAVEITPTGDVVVIGGKNGAGKSSVLNAIEMALGGKSSVPAKPVHEGADKGRVVLDLGDIIVERTFTAAGGTRLAVKAAGGSVFPSPQSLLDGLVGRLTFDPLAFARAPVKEQAETLRKLVGLDTATIDTERVAAFTQRTEINREWTRAQAAADAVVLPDGPVPEREPDPAQLVAKLEEIREHNAACQATIEKARAAAELTYKWSASVERQQDVVNKARGVLADAELELKNREGMMERARIAAQEACVAAEDAAKGRIDDAEVKADIASAQTVGAAVRAVAERKRLLALADQVKARAAFLTQRIEQLDQEKAKRTIEATFPMPWLSVTEAGVTLRGVPFSQGSSAEQLRASVAIGAALNPKLRIMLVRDGSLLDADGMTLLANFAAAAGLQCWIERVSNADAGAFIIEDGHNAGVIQ